MSETLELFATAATADRVDAGVGVIWFARHAPGDYALTVVDYDLFDVASINAEWLGTVFQRSVELAEKHERRECSIRVEHSGLVNILTRAHEAFLDTHASKSIDRTAFNFEPIKKYEAAKWPATLDERAFSIRPLIDSRKVVKLETGLRRFSFRAIKTNHLLSQIKQHRPGDAATAGELLQSFVLGVLLGTTPKHMSFFDVGLRIGSPRHDRSEPAKSPSKGPFGLSYIPGRRPR